jgi:HK97 gp10 family phage protein
MQQAVKDLRGTPIQNAMRDATLLVTRDAKKNSPVDTGRLRASITPQVDVSAETVRGIVGSNVTYAPYVELGTRPHWPPIGALEVWARRHGTSAFLVARAISRRGTPAVRYLQRAFESNKDKIEARFQRAVESIVKAAND